jgi:predicted enzyme related to lactoylglutathione lyase
MLSVAPIIAYIPVSDMARARKFYQEKLGLVAKEEHGENHEEEHGSIFECGEGTTFFMYQSPGAGTSKASQAFWAVDDLEAEMAELKAKGVRFEEYDMPALKTTGGVSVGGGAKTAWFKDSEGNILAISQRTH